MISAEKVLNALSGVRDPELDEPITDLDFVSELRVEDDDAFVRLRLPTYFCAPNFAYLMVADAREAVLSVPGVRRADVKLDDHFASDEINAGVSEERGFTGTFPREAEEELEELRDWFRRKAFVARQQKLCRELLDGGRSPEELATSRLGELPGSRAAERYLERRRELGLDVSPKAPLIVDPDGRPVPKDAVSKHLRFARTVRTNIDTNAETCRTLLATRYGTADPERADLRSGVTTSAG